MNEHVPQEFVVKICGVRTPHATASAVAAGASAIGFNFYPKSLRFLDLPSAKAIAACVPTPVAKVGVFVNPALADIERVLDSVPLDVLQLHGTLPALDSLPAALRLWRASPVGPDFTLSDLDPAFEAHLLDAPSPQFGGSGQSCARCCCPHRARRRFECLKRRAGDPHRRPLGR